MFFKYLFKKKVEKIAYGDVVILKRNYLRNFPSITRYSILKVDSIERDTALVIFMNDKGNQVLNEKIPIIALVKVG